MKPADALILTEVQKVNRRLLAQHTENSSRFDAIDEQLDEILKQIERDPPEKRDVSKELEKAIENTHRLVRSIDERVPDQRRSG